MQKDLPFTTMFFNGGFPLFIKNLSQLILFPYYGLFILALGTLLLPKPPTARDKYYFSSLNIELIRFFSGASLLVILGFTLGFLSLLFPWVTISIFCSVLYIYFLRSPNIVHNFLKLLTESHIYGNTPVRVISILIRVLILLIILYIFFTKGIMFDLSSYDVLQMYFPYFEEIRNNNSILLDPDYPVIFSFLISRGRGVHHFFTSFTSQYNIQIISVMYMISIGWIVHQVISLFIPKDMYTPTWTSTRYILPNCAMLLVLCSPMLAIETGRYHYETGAFLFYIMWASLFFVFLDNKQIKWLFRTLLPVAIAVPLMLPQSQLFIVIILLIAAFLMYFFKKFTVKYHIVLIIIGLISTLFSILLNQIYIGIAEVNPYALFLPFANPEKLQQWSSTELIYYVNNAQSITFDSPFSINGLTAFIERLVLFLVNIVNIGVTDKQSINLSILGILLCLFVLFFYNGRQIYNKFTDYNILVFSSFFFLYYSVIGLFLSLTNHGSLGRMMAFSGVYPSILLFGCIIMVGVVFRRSYLYLKGLDFPKSNNFLGFLQSNTKVYIKEIFASYMLHVMGWVSFHFKNFALILISIFSITVAISNSHKIKLNSIVPSLKYFTGFMPLDKIIPNFHHKICLDLNKIVPGNNPILPLNAAITITPICHGLPLLPRNKIIETLAPPFAKKYGDVLLGPPQDTYLIYKKLGINYFFIQKNNLQFWGPGYSDSFNPMNLMSNFDIFYEDKRFYLLTWRGKGIHPVSSETAKYIEELREKQKKYKGFKEYWKGVGRLKEWVEINN